MEGDLSDLLSFNGPEILGNELRVPSIAGGIYEIMN
jgi:hypothetical protein